MLTLPQAKFLYSPQYVPPGWSVSLLPHHHTAESADGQGTASQIAPPEGQGGEGIEETTELLT